MKIVSAFFCLTVAFWLGIMVHEIWYVNTHPRTIWEDTVMKSPDKFKPVANLSYDYYIQGNYAQALHYAQKAIAMNPEHASGYLNAVSSLMRLQPYRTSYIYLKKALEIKPSRAVAENLIFVCRKLGMTDEIKLLQAEIAAGKYEYIYQNKKES